MGRIAAFAQAIKQKREEKGWTQAKLGQEIGVSSQTISAYEKNAFGKGKVPTLDNAILLAEKLEISIDALYGLEPQTTKIKSLADVLKLLEVLEEYVDCSMSVIEVDLPPEQWETVETSYDFYEEIKTETVTQILLDNSFLTSFFSKQGEVAQLYKKGTIPKDFYESWRLGEIGKLEWHEVTNKTEAQKRLNASYSELDISDGDGELPF